MEQGSSNLEVGYFGPTAEADVRRAISRYGEAAVKEAVKKLTTRRGRPKVGGLPEVAYFCEQEAHHMLAEGTSKVRTKHAIAKEFADKNTGQSHDATMKRIERELDSPAWRGREILTLQSAWILSMNEYPYVEHLRTLEALCKEDPEDPKWPARLEDARCRVASYAAKHGEPHAGLTMQEIEQGAN